ncbi:hypothetical protein FRB96_006181 [Tulasnella sp. 330]|nr:hypothetical protein FRB96_006181 [Tulasnella sp. 330]
MLTSLWDQRRIILLTTIIDVGTLLTGYDAGVYGSALVMPSFVEKFNLATNPTEAAKLGGNTVTFYCSYWIGFGIGNWAPSDLQWRFLLGFQVILAGMYFAGIFFIPESPRHLAWLHVKEEANRRRVGLPTLPRFPGSSSGKKTSNSNDKADSDSKSIASDSPHPGMETLQSSSPFADIEHTLVDRIFLGRTKPATALSVLAYLRNRPMSSETVLDECAEIYAAVDEAEAEREADGGIRNVLLRKKGTFLRLLLTAWVGIWQGQTGQVVLLAYAPIVLKSLGLSSTTISLVASGGFTSWEFACVCFAVFIGLQRVGRVRMMTIGGIGVGLIFFMVAAIEATHPSDPLATSPSKASIAMVFLIYLWVPFFCICIGPALWLYGSEICTGSLRELGQGVFTMFTWASCAENAKATPISLVNIGWKSWLIPAVINLCFGIGAWLLMPETKGKTIEEWVSSLTQLGTS